MELGDYFQKTFSKVFTGNVFWPTLVLLFIFGIITMIILGILVLTFGMSAVYNLQKAIPNMDLNNPTAIANFSSLIPTIMGLIVAFIIFSIILSYIISVLYAFIIKRIALSESKSKKIDFFDGLGSSFLTGLKIFFANLIFSIIGYLILALIGLLLFMLGIPGIILFIIFALIYSAYLITGLMRMQGMIVLGESFGKSLGNAFTVSFKMPRLFGYTFLLFLILWVICMASMLIMWIPFINFVAMLFLYTGVFIYCGSIAYYYAKEK